MEYKVSLAEYLSGKCPYGGCKWNELGYCINEDEDFLYEIEELTKDTDKNKNIKISCTQTIYEGECPYCGAKLLLHKDKIEWWGANITMPIWYCPNGC